MCRGTLLNPNPRWLLHTSKVMTAWFHHIFQRAKGNYLISSPAVTNTPLLSLQTPEEETTAICISVFQCSNLPSAYIHLHIPALLPPPPSSQPTSLNKSISLSLDAHGPVLELWRKQFLSLVLTEMHVEKSTMKKQLSCWWRCVQHDILMILSLVSEIQLLCTNVLLSVSLVFPS